MSSRTALVVFAVVLLGAGIAAFLVLRPTSQIPPGSRPAAPPEQPLPSAQKESRIFVNVTVSKEMLREKLNQAAPQEERGHRRDPVGGAVVDDTLEWRVSRSAIDLQLGSGQVAASTTLNGEATIKGNVRIIRGDVGKILGKLNPTNLPFSVSPRFRAKARVVAQPQLTSNWRLKPSLSLDLDVHEARVPINHFGSISIRDLIRDDLNKAVTKLQRDLESQIERDPFLENEARRAQEVLCEPREIPLGSDKGILSIVPVGWEASQPSIEKKSVKVGLGLRAEIGLSLGEGGVLHGPCPPLSSLRIVEQMPPAEFALNLRASASWPSLSKLANNALENALKEKQLASCESKQIELEIGTIQLDALGDRVLALVEIRGRSCGFIRTGYEGVVQVIAKPSVDATRQALGFSDVEVAFESRENLLLAGLFGSVAEPLIKNALSRLEIDLRDELEIQRKNAEAAFEGLRKELGKSKIQSKGRIDSIELRNVIVRPDSLRLFVAAKGSFEMSL